MKEVSFSTNSLVDAYLRKARRWKPEMAKLRAILLDSGLAEDLKWGKPCYAFQQNNVVVIQPFKAFCALLFFKGVLLKDPKGILQKTGPNTRVGRQIRFTGLEEIVKLESTLKSYVQQAIDLEKAGAKVDLPESPAASIPQELEERLAQNRAFKTAFEALTPGRQRGYIIFFSAPKQSKTRAARIDRCMPRILKGKGLHD